MARTVYALLTAMAVGGTCSTSQLPAAGLDPVFGPVIGRELISGRADDEAGRVLLMAGGKAVVTIDLDAHESTRTAIQIPSADCWGLGRLTDGSLWTLRDRHALVAIGPFGELQREIPLRAPTLGLFSAGDRLLYVEANAEPPAPAVRAGAPGAAANETWSDLRLRTFNGLNHAAMMALNQVVCGVGRRAETPCWFADETAISLIDRAGRTRRVELAGLEHVAPEVLVASDRPMRPIRDVYVDPSGTIWILSSGTPPDHAPDLPGGWMLARYRSGGQAIDRRQLSAPVRLILRADGGRAVVLTGAGMVSEVRP
jgi:hypothetical protein